jgi:hypothetical protein
VHCGLASYGDTRGRGGAVSVKRISAALEKVMGAKGRGEVVREAKWMGRCLVEEGVDGAGADAAWCEVLFCVAGSIRSDALQSLLGARGMSVCVVDASTSRESVSGFLNEWLHQWEAACAAQEESQVWADARGAGRWEFFGPGFST